MDYARRQRDPTRHMLGIGFVVLLHALVIYALVTGGVFGWRSHCTRFTPAVKVPARLRSTWPCALRIWPLAVWPTTAPLTRHTRMC